MQGLFSISKHIERGSVRYFNTEQLLPELEAFKGQGINRIVYSAVECFRSFLAVKPRLTLTGKGVAELDRALVAREKAFWLTHWIGAWIGSQMELTLSERPGGSQNLLPLIKLLYNCSPEMEMWSVSHGISWHHMATSRNVSWAALTPSVVAEFGRSLCFEEMRFASDCYHGVGHGVMHMLVIARIECVFEPLPSIPKPARRPNVSCTCMPALWPACDPRCPAALSAYREVGGSMSHARSASYNVSAQLLSVNLSTEDYDAAARMCRCERVIAKPGGLPSGGRAGPRPNGRPHGRPDGLTDCLLTGNGTIAFVHSELGFAEAAGFIDGVSHAFFNWKPVDLFREGVRPWFDWCSKRLWAPMCWRNLWT